MYEGTNVGITSLMLLDDLLLHANAKNRVSSTKTYTCRERIIKCVTFCGCGKGTKDVQIFKLHNRNNMQKVQRGHFDKASYICWGIVGVV